MKKKETKRPSWDKYFMEIARLVAKRSTCLRRKVGALIVKDKRILCTGYNGTPTGIEHCDIVGCMREKLKIPAGERHELCQGLHAEQNAFLQAACYGINVKDAAIYCTNQPCIICAKMMINAGVKKVIIGDGYPDKMARDFLKKANITLRRIK